MGHACDRGDGRPPAALVIEPDGARWYRVGGLGYRLDRGEY